MSHVQSHVRSLGAQRFAASSSPSLCDSLANAPLTHSIALILFSKIFRHSVSSPSSRDGSRVWTASATHFAAITPPPIEVAIPPAVVGLTCPADSPTHTFLPETNLSAGPPT